MAQSISTLIDNNTGLPASLSDNLSQLGYTNDQYSGKGPTSTNTQGQARTNQQQNQVSSTISSNSTPEAIAALNKLLATLAGGGDANQQTISNERVAEIGRARKLQGQFSPDAAEAGGNALISKAIKDALLTLMPQITAASEGAGTSKGSMRALLTQQAGEKGATEGAALAANLGVQYGTLQSQFENTLAELTKQDPNSPLGQLAQLIIGSKSIVSSTLQSGSSTTSGTTTQNQQQQNSGQVAYQGDVRARNNPNNLNTNSSDSLGYTNDGGGYSPAPNAGTGYIAAGDGGSMDTSYMDLVASGSSDALWDE